MTKDVASSQHATKNFIFERRRRMDILVIGLPALLIGFGTGTVWSVLIARRARRLETSVEELEAEMHTDHPVGSGCLVAKYGFVRINRHSAVLGTITFITCSDNPVYVTLNYNVFKLFLVEDDTDGKAN